MVEGSCGFGEFSLRFTARSADGADENTKPLFWGAKVFSTIARINDFSALAHASFCNINGPAGL